MEPVPANRSPLRRSDRGQLRGWLLTSLVLLERAGGPLPALGDEPELQQDLRGYAKAMPG